MNPSSITPPPLPGTLWSALAPLVRFGGTGADFSFRLLRRLVWPKVELAMRLWLGQAFFVSGVIKLTHWDTALALAATEYPVGWMDPVTAAYLGVAIEVIGGALLSVGLLTRWVAIPMLALALVAQVFYLPFDTQLFWVALLGRTIVFGAGAFSLDHLLARGLADSALPWVASFIRIGAWMTAHAGPLALSLLRVWFALALLGSARPDLLHALGAAGAALPIHAAALVPAPFALLGGALLLLGLATRYVAIGIALALSVGTMADPRLTDAAYILMLLAVLIADGAGVFAVDRVLAALFADQLAQAERRGRSLEGLPRVVIVGAGFGGIGCAAALRGARVAVTLIDQANYHLFQPLLYQVATAALSPGDIAAPIRPLFRDAANTTVLLGRVTGIDTQRRLVLTGDKQLPYDYLVVATGATHSYFGKDQWAPFAPGLKRIEDATEIRRRVLTAFERAEATDDTAVRDALLTFLIVGGGPTGVELAGAIAELTRHGMDKEFRHFDPASARVILVQSAPRLLPTFTESLSAIARQSLERMGVTVLLGSRVEQIDADGVQVSGQRIAAKTVLWAAGVTASPAALWLNAQADAAGRVKVGADLSVPGLPNVFVVGDTAASNAWNGGPVPGLAPAAKQGGRHVARVIRARIAGKAAPAPFVYRHYGSLATIGRKAAVVDFGGLRLWGAPAWWLWGVLHVGFLVGMRNRVATMINWFWSYLTFGGGIRLITGGDARATEPPRVA
jgi:NADH dehydrogenase/putative oxidoreductase